MNDVVIAPPTQLSTRDRFDFALEWYLKRSEEHAAQLNHLPLMSELHLLKLALVQVRNSVDVSKIEMLEKSMEQIRSLCDAPHFDADRKRRIREIANIALI